ncbi:hematopoietically-expressed homeobox protein hhex-like [Anopheles maculipalpis]|uniref:hematopoietically-expressed homeobox protein hhex-like n=1 Tax=Anopheles maculipalpis TaxID=1496333 RepID=UPI002158A84C|nr:hematopoietically-expressed homeobox protein hhex-like [Anopheles maculipalpis]
MWDTNNDMVQRDRFFESECIGYRAVCDRSLEVDESTNRKLTFGIERLLSMPTSAQREIKRCETFLSTSCNEDAQIQSKCECCDEYKGNELLSNLSKFFISDSDKSMGRAKYGDSVCETNVPEYSETRDCVTLGLPCENDTNYSKVIRKPLPLRIGNAQLGQGNYTSLQTADSITFSHTTPTTPRFVDSWHCDTAAPFTDKYNDCALYKAQSPAVDINSLRTNSCGVSATYNKSSTQAIISRRKRSWSRAVFSSLQRKGLEKTFQEQKYITKPDRKRLAATLGLHDAQVKVWFQNRRMKWRHMVKNTSLLSIPHHTEVEQSPITSPSCVNAEVPEMLALDDRNEANEDDDVIID